MGAWQEIVDYTVPSNTTEVTFNFDPAITKNDFIKISISHIFNTGTSLRWNVNGNTNESNYYRQFLTGSGSTVSAARFTAGSLNTGSEVGGFGISYLKISENNVANTFTSYTSRLDSTVITDFVYSTTSGLTVSTITSLRIYTSSANNLVTGTRIQIYKLAAEKVADITVGSNTTQVDISSLSIDKDSEYLLVSDWVTGNNINCNVTPNDSTTLTGYYHQRIFANNTTNGASRENNPNFVGINNNRALSYQHIKLSNIGAYTNQSYTIQLYGSTTPIIVNSFISSTVENITSITKLNIFGSGAGATNGISADSRFILYKLYE